MKIRKKHTLRIVRNKEKNSSAKDWALLGSVIGNILQAIGQASTARTLSAAQEALQRVTADRNFLMNKLKKWQMAYLSLKDKADKLERGFIELRNELSSQTEEIYRLQKDQLSKDDEINRLKRENAALKEENEKLKKKD